MNVVFPPANSCKRLLSSVILLVSGLLAGGQASAQTYIASFSDAQWKAESGDFACGLNHEIPGFGNARLARKAGAGESLELSGKSLALGSGTFKVEAIAPAWLSDVTPRTLGQAQANNKTLKVSGAQIAAITASLEQGTNVIFSGNSLHVGLAARNFGPAFNTYKNCVKNLIPYTFKQLSHTILSYEPDADELSPKSKAELDKIVRYVKADKQVLGIIVDAHSDKLPKPEQGEALAKREAEWVTAYLVEKGIPADTITTRAHGDKFPIADNKTKAGQAKNRRVTVRLENAETRKEMEKKVAAIKAAEEKAAAEKVNSSEREKSVPAIDARQLEDLTEQQNLLNGKQPEAGLPR